MQLGKTAIGKGLFRTVLGGDEGTVAAVFRNLGGVGHADKNLHLFHARVDLPEQDGHGYWRFISPAAGIYVVLTDCNYATPRHEKVVAENLVEFHFLLEGPVELSIPEDAEANAPSSVSLFACGQAPHMAYDVVCQTGSYRMATIYVAPQLLMESFGFGRGSVMAEQLLNPAAGTMAMTEHKIGVDFLRVLRDLFEINFDEVVGTPLAAARILELLVLSVDAINRISKATDESVVFTAKELEMFERARHLLATDFSEGLTIPGLARTLGTNATKLKGGFRLLFGTTIFSYRNRYRMDLALQRLVNDRLPIAVVSHEVGFRHQASFTSAFRAHFGFTPKQARQRVAVQGTKKNA